MKGTLFVVGCLLGMMAGALTVMIWRWVVGPEFWLFVPAFLVVGGLCVYASWEAA